MTDRMPPFELMKAPVGGLPDTAKLYFRINSATRPANASSTLSDIIKHLNDNAGSKAMVTGFHDSTGNLELNQALSLKRADTVANALIQAVIPRNRILVTKPTQTVGTGTSNEARRVEVKISQ